MSGLLENASAILAVEAKRLEVAGQNVANGATPGYKSESIFAEALAHGAAGTNHVQSALTTQPQTRLASDLSQGKLSQTDNPLDFAIAGPGFFQVQTADGVGYSRGGQFHVDDKGRLVTPQGWILQAQGGGDVFVRSNSFLLQADGTITEDGRPTTRVAIVDLNATNALTRGNGGVFKLEGVAPQDTETPQIKQGYLEMSNVNTAADMVHLVESMRLAESAQKLILTYDDLLGRVLSTLGQLQ